MSLIIMYDEMLKRNGDTSNKLYKKLYSWLNDQNSSILLKQSIKAEELFRKVGITFNVYGNDKAEERLIPVSYTHLTLPTRLSV